MKVLAALPLVLVPLVFVVVLRSGTPPAPFVRTELPDEPFDSARCTWACHNYGCHHRAKLPDALTGDAHLFGWAIRALHRWGDAVSPDDSFAGYGAVNLAVFCMVWPGSMYGLWLVALRARARRRALERRRA